METQTIKEKRIRSAERKKEKRKDRLSLYADIVYCKRQQRENVTLTLTVLSEPGDLPF